MGLGNISPVQLLIVLVIVALIFGTKKLRSLGGDVGGAVRGFKKAMNDEETKDEAPVLTHDEADTTAAKSAADAQKTS